MEKNEFQGMIQELEDKKAENVILLDLRKHPSLVDYMIIASGTSTKHLHALAEHLYRNHKHSFSSVHIEEGPEWVLVDFGPVVVHIFKPETREIYNLEKMWSVQ